MHRIWTWLCGWSWKDTGRTVIIDEYVYAVMKITRFGRFRGYAHVHWERMEQFFQRPWDFLPAVSDENTAL